MHLNNNSIGVYFKLLNPKKIEKGSTVRLSFLDKNSEKEMNIYFRFNRDFVFGDKLQLDNMFFYEGNYFYEMCDSKKIYTISEEKKYQTKIDLNKLKKHKISLNKLSKLLKKCECK